MFCPSSKGSSVRGDHCGSHARCRNMVGYQEASRVSTFQNTTFAFQNFDLAHAQPANLHARWVSDVEECGPHLSVRSCCVPLRNATHAPPSSHDGHVIPACHLLGTTHKDLPSPLVLLCRPHVCMCWSHRLLHSLRTCQPRALWPVCGRR